MRLPRRQGRAGDAAWPARQPVVLLLKGSNASCKDMSVVEKERERGKKEVGKGQLAAALEFRVLVFA